MKLKQTPEDFVVREAWRVDFSPKGPWNVYLMDKQKLSTFEAVRRICDNLRIPPAAVSFCGLKDKQGRTEQLIAIRGREAQMQEPDLRLKFLGRTDEPLSAANLTANRFAITVRDLSEEDVARLPSAVAEVRRVGVVNYFDSQRFGGVKHGQGFLAKDLIRGDIEHALFNYMAKPSPMDATEDAKVKQFWADNWGNWSKHCPFRGVARYRNVLMHLRNHPKDWEGAFLRIEPRYRALILFEYQSYLWNEGVRELLVDALPEEELISMRYQAGRLLFPRDLPGPVLRDYRERTFPLLGPDSPRPDEETVVAVERVLEREKLNLQDLELRHIPQMFFKHEERPLLVFPEKLVVGRPQVDDFNRRRLKVNVAFTLPPGAYATLVTKRLFWFGMLEEEAKEQGELHPIAEQMLTRAFGGPSSELAPPEEEVPEPPKPREPRPEGDRKPMGFLERQRLRKEAKAERRSAKEETKAAAAKAAGKGKKKKAAPKKKRAPARSKAAGGEQAAARSGEAKEGGGAD